MNRNKRSIMLNLKEDAGREVVYRLVSEVLRALGYDDAAIAKLRADGVTARRS